MPGVTSVEPYLTVNGLFVAGELPGGVCAEAHAISNEAPMKPLSVYIVASDGT